MHLQILHFKIQNNLIIYILLSKTMSFSIFIGNILIWNAFKTRPKSLEWCARLIRSLYWLIRLIWIGFLDLWVDLTDLVYLIGWLNNRSIDFMSYSKSKYLMVANFMGYYTRIKISHGCRFHEILHQNKKYLMVADFMRY